MNSVFIFLALLTSCVMAADPSSGDWEPGFEKAENRERAIFEDLWSKYWMFRYYQERNRQDMKALDHVIERTNALSRADTKREGPPGPRREEGKRDYEMLLKEIHQTWLSWKDEWQTALKGETVFDLNEVFWKARTFIVVDTVLNAKNWNEFKQARWDYLNASDLNSISPAMRIQIVQIRTQLEESLAKARLAQSKEQSPPMKDSKP